MKKKSGSLASREKIKKNRFRKGGRKKEAGLLKRVSLTMGLILLISFTTVLMGGFFVFTYDMVTQSDYFAIKVIQVSGLSTISEGDILKQAGIEKGMNILGMNLNQVRKKLLAHPFIESVAVERLIPSELRIHIRENRPLAVADIGAFFLINEKGWIFKKKEPSDPKNLPMIKGLTLWDFDDYKAENRKSPYIKDVMNFLTFSKTQTGMFSYKNIRMVQMDREVGLSLFLDGPIRTIKFGFSDYQQKCERVKEILALSGQINQITHIGEIDLNKVNRVVVTPAET